MHRAVKQEADENKKREKKTSDLGFLSEHR